VLSLPESRVGKSLPGNQVILIVPRRANRYALHCLRLSNKHGLAYEHFARSRMQGGEAHNIPEALPWFGTLLANAN